MSNQAYERLHKLVGFLVNNKILSEQKLATMFEVTLEEFEAEFVDDIDQ